MKFIQIQKAFTPLLLLLQTSVLGQISHLNVIETNTNASFRGLSVVDDSIAWVSGSNGWVGKSTNGGKRWVFNKVPGFEKKDFRSLYAFNAYTAIIANAGSPANILRTDDGGLHWNIIYTNTDSLAFFDGIDFWSDKEGIIYGDPQLDRMELLYTKDTGRSWLMLVGPVLEKGESSFAASGTGIRCMNSQKVIISTGGKASRLLISMDKGDSWSTIQTPIIQGRSSTGIFSFDFLNDTTGIIVGGDYLRDTLCVDHVFLTKNGGQSWSTPKTPTRGYRECVTYVTEKTILATGPTGTDISYDGGNCWQVFSDEKSFHVVKKARKGKAIIMAGGKGKVALIKNSFD